MVIGCRRAAEQETSAMYVEIITIDTNHHFVLDTIRKSCDNGIS
jgi:hypothetical protein